jgi:hypothetical protein
MMKRRRFKQTTSLSERLVQNVEQLEAKLATLPPGPERDRLVRQIRQNEIAANIDQWLKSTGLQPPQEVKRLGG